MINNRVAGRVLPAFFMFCVSALPVHAQSISAGTAFKIGSGASLTTDNSMSVTSGGILDVQGTLILKKNLVNMNSSASNLGSGLIELSGSNAQTISGQNIIQDLRVNNPAGVGLSGDTWVTGVLRLKNGVISLGSSNLLLGPSASDSGGSATSMVEVTGTGQFRKEFTTTPVFPKSFTFPVGDTSGTAEYSPVAVNFTSGTFSSGNYLGVTLKNLPDPDPDIATGDYLSRYWTLNSSGISATISCGLTFTFTDADINGSRLNLYCVKTAPALETFNAVSGNQLTGTVSGFSRFTGADAALQGNFKAFLQGPYDSAANQMNKTLATTLTLGDRADLTKFPSNQPYNGSPWFYTGTESVVSLPPNVVDWVLVDLRQGTAPANADSASTFARRAGFLLQDGTIVDLDGTSPLKFYHATLTHNLYPVIRHRNHMAIMAMNSVTKDVTGSYIYDYSTGTSKVWGGASGVKQIDLNPARWAMIAADANADNNIWNNDYTNFYVPTFFLGGQYRPADFNLDANVWNNDYTNFYVPNFFISNPLP